MTQIATVLSPAIDARGLAAGNTRGKGLRHALARHAVGVVAALVVARVLTAAFASLITALPTARLRPARESFVTYRRYRQHRPTSSAGPSTGTCFLGVGIAV
jgi:hypothetical protein